MAKHEAVTTQSQHPWRATVRTILAVIVALAAIAPSIYTAATQGSLEAATGAGALALGIAAAITRIMALPAVEVFLQRFIPWLAAGRENDRIIEPSSIRFGEDAVEGSSKGYGWKPLFSTAEGTQFWDIWVEPGIGNQRPDKLNASPIEAITFEDAVRKFVEFRPEMAKEFDFGNYITFQGRTVWSEFELAR